MQASPLTGIAVWFLVLTLPCAAETAKVEPPFENPRIKIAYNAPQNPALVPIYTQLKQYQVLEELKQFLTPLRLPTVLALQADQCGGEVRPYKHGGPVTICYELIAKFEGIIGQHTESGSEMQRFMNTGSIIEALLHEIAYALFDIYDVPVWGRIDDAADRTAAFIMLQFGEDVGLTTIVGTANLFLWSNKTWSGLDFAAPNSPEAQRFYNYVCIAYGGDPKLFKFLVDNGTLPPFRAERCEGEYEQVKKAFNLRIMPYIDPDMLVKSKAHDW